MKIMKKDEILWLYELGERNFRRQNLSGKSFRGEDLSGVDFSGSDLRGADFSNAILRGVNFTNSKAGLQKRQAIALFTVLLLLSGLLGLFAGFVGTFIELKFYSANGLAEATAKWVTVSVGIAFSLVTLSRGITMGFLVFIVAFIAPFGMAVISSDMVQLAGQMSITVLVNALVAVATAAAGMIAITSVLAFRAAAAIAIASSFIFAFSFAIAIANNLAPTSAHAFAVALAANVMVLNAYIGWRAIEGDERHLFTWLVANSLASKWGTSFRGADLTEADFTRAILKSTDFSDANLTRTRWNKTVGSTAGISVF